ncbi:MAG: hypothetical protein SWH54_18180 [Thermodesulfobacteriota bacterium]|nr:hypothetical protein [Thermodesulfobacteriota bacterium]
MNTVKFIGMDVHKKAITIAIADESRQKQARIYLMQFLTKLLNFTIFGFGQQPVKN